MTLEGRAQSLLRHGRHLWRGGDRRRPPSRRRGPLLLASCVVALVVAPHALADTSTTPAPDPNPPPGAAPDPYAPPAKAPPPRPAPVHTTPHVYSPPAYTPPAQTVPVQHVTPRAVTPVTPARPTVVHHPAVHKARHRARKRHVVLHHKPKPVVVRLTPRAESYVTSVVKTMSTVAPAPPDSSRAPRRRRAAGVALFVLAAGSLGLVFLAGRSRRTLST